MTGINITSTTLNATPSPRNETTLKETSTPLLENETETLPMETFPSQPESPGHVKRMAKSTSKVISDWPQPFTPTIATDGHGNELWGVELHEQVKLDAKENLRHRVMRVGFLFFSCAMFITLGVYSVDQIELMQVFGIGLATIAANSTFQLLSIWIKAHCFQKKGGLYRVYSLTAIPSGWTSMAIAYRAVLYKNEPIGSISEFCAIQGGRGHLLLYGTAISFLNTVISAFVAELVINEKYGSDEKSWLDFDHISILLGVSGFVIVGMFELDPFNQSMKIGHYIGVFFTLFGLYAFNHQQAKKVIEGSENGGLVFAVVLDVMALCGGMSWQFNVDRGRKYVKSLEDAVQAGKVDSKSDVTEGFDADTISQMSFNNLISEFVFIFAEVTAICSWFLLYPVNDE